jgi:hypothetical protein
MSCPLPQGAKCGTPNKEKPTIKSKKKKETKGRNKKNLNKRAVFCQHVQLSKEAMPQH